MAEERYSSMIVTDKGFWAWLQWAFFSSEGEMARLPYAGCHGMMALIGLIALQGSSSLYMLFSIAAFIPGALVDIKRARSIGLPMYIVAIMVLLGLTISLMPMSIVITLIYLAFVSVFLFTPPGTFKKEQPDTDTAGS